MMDWLNPLMPPLTLQLTPALWWGWDGPPGAEAPILVAAVAAWCRDWLSPSCAACRVRLDLEDICVNQTNYTSHALVPAMRFGSEADLILFKLLWL
jgi:hypothetical protein